MERNINKTQLLNNAGMGKRKVYLVNWINNTIRVIATNEVCHIPGPEIMSVALELVDKCVPKWHVDFRTANIGIGMIIARDKEFEQYIKAVGLDDHVKPFAQLMK